MPIIFLIVLSLIPISFVVAAVITAIFTGSLWLAFVMVLFGAFLGFGILQRLEISAERKK